MALIRVCDNCRCSLEETDNKNYVDIDYHVRRDSYSMYKTVESITLCEDCFNELLSLEKGCKVSELFPYPQGNDYIQVERAKK